MCVCVSVSVCVCVCVSERVCVCVCVSESVCECGVRQREDFTTKAKDYCSQGPRLGG